MEGVIILSLAPLVLAQPRKMPSSDEEDKKEQVEDDFYEKAEEDKQPSASASRPLPEVSMFVCRVNISDLLRKVVPMDKVEPMQLNGENSLLGQWTANSQSSAPMDLQVCGN